MTQTPVLLGALPLLVAACGSVEAEAPHGHADAGHAPPPAQDGGADAVRPVVDGGGDAAPPCPVVLPADGSPCAIADFICDYGSNPNPECNTLVQCIDLAWQSMEVRRCPEDPAPCPSSVAAASGTSCSAADQPELCAFPDGTCVCGYDGHGLPPSRWICTPPAEGCPDAMPVVGTRCAPSAGAPTLCGYGGCLGPSVTCLGGFWSLYPSGCA